MNKEYEWEIHLCDCHTHSLVVSRECVWRCDWCGRRYLQNVSFCNHGDDALCWLCNKSLCDYGGNDLPEREITL